MRLRRAILAALLAAAPAVADWRELQSGWHEIQTPPSSSGSATPSTCVTAGQIPFLGSPTSLGLGCDAGLTYNAATDVLTSGRILVGDGSAAEPSVAFAGSPTTGMINRGGGQISFIQAGTAVAGINGGFELPALRTMGWATTNLGSPVDLVLSRGAAATLQLGAANSATPVAQRLKVQDGVGTNIAAAATVIHDGPYGTGTGAVGEFVIQTGAVQASGATAHVPTKRLGIKELHINLRLGDVNVYANNAAALAGGLVAGDLYRTGADPDPVMIVH